MGLKTLIDRGFNVFRRVGPVDNQRGFMYFLHVKGKAMKHAGGALLLLAALSAAAFGQFKSQVENPPSASQALIHPMSGISSFLGLLDPERFLMRHNFEFSYMTGGGQGLSLASYTNSMFYKISDPLNVRFDVTLQGSPFGASGGLQQSDLNRLFISNAELNYRPLENMFIKVQYSQLPANYFSGIYPYYPSYWGND